MTYEFDFQKPRKSRAPSHLDTDALLLSTLETYFKIYFTYKMLQRKIR